MMVAFADTFYYLAIVHPADEAHQRTLAHSKKRGGHIITTAWVLTEVADALCGPVNRPVLTRLIDAIRSDPNTEIVPPGEDLFNRGLDLYSRRIDKSWSLTNRVSFVVMADRRLTDALTWDHHFEQVGFRVILRTS
jgi:predicted nucleic acid-binding protein